MLTATGMGLAAGQTLFLSVLGCSIGYMNCMMFKHNTQWGCSGQLTPKCSVTFAMQALSPERHECSCGSLMVHPLFG